MNREQAEMKIKAAAYAAAAELGPNEAVKLLKEIANEIDSAQWRGGGGR
jgi:hypothetical protein